MNLPADMNQDFQPTGFSDAAGNPIAVPAGTTFTYSVDNPIVVLGPPKSASLPAVNVAGTGVGGNVNLTAVATFPDGTTDTGNVYSIVVTVPDPTVFSLNPVGAPTLNTPAPVASAKKPATPPKKP